MADDSSSTAPKRYVNLNDLYKQAYEVSTSTSWYKHVKNTTNAYVYLVLPPPTKSDDEDGHLTTNPPFKLDVCLEFQQGIIDFPVIVPTSMTESSRKYPVTLTYQFGGHEGPTPRVARYMFDKYLFFLKRHGLAAQDAVELPQRDKSHPMKLETSVRLHSITISDCDFSHEKWRMIGLIVRAACNLAKDEGIEVIDTPPYPPNSTAWSYLRSDEQRRSTNEE